MPANFITDRPTIIRFLPEIILTIVGTLLMVLDPLMRRAVASPRSGI